MWSCYVIANLHVIHEAWDERINSVALIDYFEDYPTRYPYVWELLVSCPVLGVNSFVTRSIKKIASTASEDGKDLDIFIVGEKGRSQLGRLFPHVSVCPTPGSPSYAYLYVTSRLLICVLHCGYCGWSLIFSYLRAASSFDYVLMPWAVTENNERLHGRDIADEVHDGASYGNGDPKE